MMGSKQKVVVVGAGPVGALAALYAAVRGDEVEVYELRGDLRDPSTTLLNFTRSINLALSERGINAMRKADCDGLINDVLKESIPMRGRMIHGKTNAGEFYQAPQDYDVHGRSINAIDRSGLNARLLDKLSTYPNVKLFFLHKLTGADFNKNTAWFELQTSTTHNTHAEAMGQRFPEIEVPFDLLIGADGAHSAARFHMMKYARLNYAQEYIDSLWCEFIIPPSPKGDFLISPNHLHIWPGTDCMFIAIASLDKSFTCTLFAPSSYFASLSSPTDASDPTLSLLEFFNRRFPGVVPALISPANLHEQFTRNPHLPLISLSLSPYHYSSSVVLLGDAAHAMVPFYGQGMNAGLEDVRILFENLDRSMLYSATSPAEAKDFRAKALEAYTNIRRPDAHAISSLALQNYVEMRSSVTSPLYKIRKRIEEFLSKYVPGLGWETQYARVSFSNERYGVVGEKALRQGRILAWILGALGMGGLSVVLAFVVRFWLGRRRGGR